MRLHRFLIFGCIILGFSWGCFDPRAWPKGSIALLLKFSGPTNSGAVVPTGDNHCALLNRCFPRGTPQSKVLREIGEPDRISVIKDYALADQIWDYSDLRILVAMKEGKVTSAVGKHFHE